MQELIATLKVKYPTLPDAKITRLAFIENQLNKDTPSQPLPTVVAPRPTPVGGGVTLISTLPRVEDASCDGCE